MMTLTTPRTRTLTALVLLLAYASAAAASDRGEMKPPTAKAPPQDVLDACYPVSARRLSTEGRMVMTLTISPAGQVTRVDLPPESDPWMREAADCIAPKFRVTPGTLDGVPTETKATIPITFHLRDSRLSDEPSAVTLPTVSSSGDEILDIYRTCYPADLDVSAQVLYKITISKGGKLFHPELIEGSGRDRIDQAGLCILEKLRFSPARRDGRAVVATLSWPLLVRPPPDR